MTTPEIAAYGAWRSPITTNLITSQTIGLGQIWLDGEDIYWSELRPSEKGRNVIVRLKNGAISDVTPAGYNVRTRVHEYGGASFLVVNGTVYFVNFADQRLYCQSADSAPQAITPEVAKRYADAIFDHQRQRIICVCEDHSVAGQEAVNTVVSIGLTADSTPQQLVAGKDFYAAPRLSPDGSRLAWLSWNHPNMPWDGTELWVAEVQADGFLGKAEKIAGGIEESIFQPQWSPDGTLYFISDCTGWWNLYRWQNQTVEALTEMTAEFGKPLWVLGMRTYDFESSDRIICTYTQEGIWHLASLDTKTKQLEPLPNPYTDISSLHTAPGKVFLLGGSPTEQTSIVQLDLASQKLEVLRRASDVQIAAGYLSLPQAIAYPTSDGKTAYALFYPPQNQDYTAPDGEKPPLIVKSHGGPTAAAGSSLNFRIQYWTSRGIAVLDVNYGGSTGYGREYRQRLDGQWGIVDVDDCVDGARYLVEKGVVDGNRLAISGGSAGGYTTLCALTFRDTFKAGASHYGVSDLEALARDTHKFESRYLDRLIGKYPEQQQIYQERSPINFTERLASPVIFFQGLEDQVVPPNQTEAMVTALRVKGVPVAYLPFPGEQHGFRQAENIKRSLEGELYFYSQIFGFELADTVEPLRIENF
ncbi:S9 family peptidase [Calothrix sp. FACHB-1219]|uniref:S9 family peptidase n=1 Tax=unclassified Calothrix TaxID=2619626 RepID=UPI0016896B7A|nr:MULTISPECIES: S9 family peptidase [unclassified Calothrix]MBD2203307.1 S9 family peptidase [Calothrix sp. FACHB-168]MBD2216397.1 S9 family peptidase [Calothrix sp. FACHB-1219]